jgi:hypothetical protein
LLSGDGETGRSAGARGGGAGRRRPETGPAVEIDQADVDERKRGERGGRPVGGDAVVRQAVRAVAVADRRVRGLVHAVVVVVVVVVDVVVRVLVALVVACVLALVRDLVVVPVVGVRPDPVVEIEVKIRQRLEPRQPQAARRQRGQLSGLST